MIRLSYLTLIVSILGGCGDNNHPGSSDGNTGGSDSGVDAPIDAPPCTVSSSKLDTMMSGDITFDVTELEKSVPLNVDLTKSILFTTTREDEPSPKFGGVMCQLHDPDVNPAGITCDRTTAGTESTTEPVTVHWSVATFSSGVTVQRGTANTGFTNPTILTLAAPADPKHSFVLIGGIDTGGSGWGNNEFMRGQLTDAMTLDLHTNVAGSQTTWQVVTMSDAEVQRGTATLGTSDLDTTATLSKTLSTDGFVLASYTTDNASGIASSGMMVNTSVKDAMTLDFVRNSGGANIDISWEAINFPFAVHRGVENFAVAETMKTETVSGLSAMSVAIASSQPIVGQATGATTYNGVDSDLVGEAAFTMNAAVGSVTIKRATSVATAAVSWNAIDFSHNVCVP